MERTAVPRPTFALSQNVAHMVAHMVAEGGGATPDLRLEPECYRVGGAGRRCHSFPLESFDSNINA